MYIIKLTLSRTAKTAVADPSAAANVCSSGRLFPRAVLPTITAKIILFLKFSDGYKRRQGHSEQTTDYISPYHVLLATHSDHLSRSKLTVHKQRGTIPVKVGRTKSVNDKFRDDGNVC